MQWLTFYSQECKAPTAHMMPHPGLCFCHALGLTHPPLSLSFGSYYLPYLDNSISYLKTFGELLFSVP